MHVAVLGAGTMGHGIAQVTAMAGHSVSLRDVNEDRLSTGLDGIRENLAEGIEREKVTAEERERTLARIEGTTDLSVAVDDADLVIEAIPEEMALKQSTFADVEAAAPEDAILATNTSSLSVTEIGSVLDRPGWMVGLHFFNPPHIMALVEIVLAEQTTEATANAAEVFVEGIGKTPVIVEDSPGFVTSRLGVVLGAEAIRMLQTGVAPARDIDRAMELGYNHPLGPIELTDVVGLDVRLDVLEYLREELGERFRPPHLLRQKVRAGKLGRKSGEGFYKWSDGNIVDGAGKS